MTARESWERTAIVHCSADEGLSLREIVGTAAWSRSEVVRACLDAGRWSWGDIIIACGWPREEMIQALTDAGVAPNYAHHAVSNAEAIGYDRTRGTSD